MKERLIADLERMEQFEFQRAVIRRRLDRSGEVQWQTSYVFHVEPTPDGGFLETLLALDGRQPTAAEVRSHRRAGRFAKHRQQILEGSELEESDADSMDGLGVLAAVLFLADVELAGDDECKGIRTVKLRLVPRSAPEHGSQAERVAAASRGFLHIDRRTRGLVCAQLSLTRDVAVSLMNFQELAAEYEAVKVEDAWLPSRLIVQSTYRAAGFRRAHLNTYRYSGFRREE